MDLPDVVEMNCEQKITMHVNSNRFRNIQEFEEAIKKQFVNSIVAALKTKNGYYAEIFVLKDDLPEYNKEYLKALVSLYALRKQIEELEDPELEYIAEKAYFNTLCTLAKATNEVIKSYIEANEAYRALRESITKL